MRICRLRYYSKMTDAPTSPHASSKTVEQLQEEFRSLNELAMEIQAKMAALEKRLTEAGFKPKRPGSDTVKF